MGVPYAVILRGSFLLKLSISPFSQILYSKLSEELIIAVYFLVEV